MGVQQSLPTTSNLVAVKFQPIHVRVCMLLYECVCDSIAGAGKVATEVKARRR